MISKKRKSKKVVEDKVGFEEKKEVAIETSPVAQEHLDDAHAMKEQLSKQPKVSFLIPLGPGENEGSTDQVCLNGYKLKIKKGVMVELPQQVAEILANKYKVQMMAGRESLVSRSAKVEEALG